MRLRSLSSSFPQSMSLRSLGYLTAHQKTCTEPSPGLLTSRDKGLRRSGYRESGLDTDRLLSWACYTQRNGALLILAGRLESSAILPSSHLGSVWIFGGLTMSAREKGILTKDSVSLLPCFYFVEVGWCRMLPIQSCSVSPSNSTTA